MGSSVSGSFWFVIWVGAIILWHFCCKYENSKSEISKFLSLEFICPKLCTADNNITPLEIVRNVLFKLHLVKITEKSRMKSWFFFSPFWFLLCQMVYMFFLVAKSFSYKTLGRKYTNIGGCERQCLTSNIGIIKKYHWGSTVEFVRESMQLRRKWIEDEETR